MSACRAALYDMHSYNRYSIKKNGRILKTVPLLKSRNSPVMASSQRCLIDKGMSVEIHTHFYTHKNGQSFAADSPLQRARGCFALRSTWRRSMQTSVVTSAYFYKKSRPVQERLTACATKSSKPGA